MNKVKMVLRLAYIDRQLERGERISEEDMTWLYEAGQHFIAFLFCAKCENMLYHPESEEYAFVCRNCSPTLVELLESRDVPLGSTGNGTTGGDSGPDSLDYVLHLKTIRGALKMCIDAHGPITRNLPDSAAKRIQGYLQHRARQALTALDDTKKDSK